MPKTKRNYVITAIPYRLVLKRPINQLSTKRESVPNGEILSDPTDPKKGKIDFITMTSRFLDSISKFVNIEEESSGLRLDSAGVDADTHQELRCVIKSGKYGYAAELYDTKGKQPLVKRSKSQCELFPFACRFVFSGGLTEAILVVEKFGPHSIVGILESAFERYLTSNGYLGWRVDFCPISSKQYVERNLNYMAKSIHLLGRQVPKDVVSCIGEDVLGRDFEADVELTVKFKRRFVSIKSLYDKFATNVKDGLIINKTRYDGISAEIPIAGKTRKVYLDNLDRFLLQLDVSDSVEYNADGHPKPQSFYQAAEEALSIAKHELGGW